MIVDILKQGLKNGVQIAALLLYALLCPLSQLEELHTVYLVGGLVEHAVGCALAELINEVVQLLTALVGLLNALLGNPRGTLHELSSFQISTLSNSLYSPQPLFQHLILLS